MHTWNNSDLLTAQYRRGRCLQSEHRAVCSRDVHSEHQSGTRAFLLGSGHADTSLHICIPQFQDAHAVHAVKTPISQSLTLLSRLFLDIWTNFKLKTAYFFFLNFKAFISTNKQNHLPINYYKKQNKLNNNNNINNLILKIWATLYTFEIFPFNKVWLCCRFKCKFIMLTRESCYCWGPEALRWPWCPRCPLLYRRWCFDRSLDRPDRIREASRDLRHYLQTPAGRRAPSHPRAVGIS